MSISIVKSKLYLFLLAVVLVLMTTVISEGSFSKRYASISISDNRWMATHNGKYLGQSADDDIMSAFGISLNKGDLLILSGVLPDIDHTDFPSLTFQYRYCAFNIYLNGELLDSRFMSEFQNNRYIGTGRYTVSLPEDYQGKLLTIEIYTAKDGIRKTITDINLGDYSDLEGLHIRRFLSPFLTGSAMIILGYVMIVLSLILMPFRKEVLSHLYTGGFFTTIGIGLHCYYGLTSLYANTDKEFLIFEGVLLLLMPLFLLYFVIVYRPKHTKIFYVLAGIAFIYFIIRVALHSSGRLYLGFTDDLKLFQIANSIPYAQYLWMLILSSLCLYFLMDGLHRFFRASTSSMTQNSEYSKLSHVAFEDPLTKLMNRAGLNDQFEIFDSDGTDYYIIHFDVNDLKKTNDKYGHQMGDELLKCFAKGLSAVFGRTSGVCARQGGDEFTVLMRTRYDENILKLLDKLDKRLILESKKAGLPFEVHAAHGYPYRANFKTVHEAAMAADQHMYECKHKMKNKKE